MLTGILHDIYGNYIVAFVIGIGVSGLSAAAIWLAAPGKIRAVAGQLHRSHAATTGRGTAAYRRAHWSRQLYLRSLAQARRL